MGFQITTSTKPAVGHIETYPLPYACCRKKKGDNKMANLTPPSIVFQPSYSSLGGIQGGALQVPTPHPPILMNYNVLILFRHAGDYLFHNPTFDNPDWETVLVPAAGIPFTTSGPITNQVFAF